MEFKRKVELSSKRADTKITDFGRELLKKYPFNISLYLDPPTDSISLKEFEEYAVARLKLLRSIERVNLSCNAKYSKEWCQELQNDLEKLQLHEFVAVITEGAKGMQDKSNLDELYNYRRYDNISHFILRLAYCRSEDLRKWFVALEVDFFRLRLHNLGNSSRKDFLEHYELDFKKVDPATVLEFKQQIINATSTSFVSNVAATDVDYYEVSFNVVPDLVKQRRVFLRNGLAFLPHTEIDLIIATHFRKTLSHCVALTRKAIPEIQEDERLSQILSDFDKRYTGKSYDTKKGNDNSVHMDDLPDKSKNSFPLCMKELYNVVEKDHHLKHFGRLQLGLFLKGIGLSMEEATKFWRSNFTKKAGMDGNRFDKQYLYNIRHMYGKEGKRADYTPYSCIKIITSSVGTGDHHGCPFRHYDSSSLRSRLVAANIPESGVREIMKLVEDKHFQIACTKYFEYTHGNATVSGGIQHPNQYFEESEKPSYTLDKTKKNISN